MRPQAAQPGTRGKGPAQKRPAPPPDSDDSWEEDLPEEEEGVAPAPLPVRRQIAFRHQVDPNNPMQLPAELLPRPPQQYDLSDEEGEDHTGFWQPGDLEALILALNHYRGQLKGKFTGTAGGKERKARAWQKVADYINRRCATRWTAGQCKGKARRYCLEVKNKFHALRRELNKTGNQEIPDKFVLSRLEEMLLDYVGVDGVVGIPGIQGVPLRPDQGRDYLRRRSENARKVWNHDREERPNYREPLPTERIRLEVRRLRKK